MSTSWPEVLAYPGLLCLGLVASSPLAQHARLRDVLKGLPNIPNAKWPLLLVALCAAVLGLLGIWCVVKALCSASGPGPTEREDGKGERTRDDVRSHQGEHPCSSNQPKPLS